MKYHLCTKLCWMLKMQRRLIHGPCPPEEHTQTSGDVKTERDHYSLMLFIHAVIELWEPCGGSN